MPALKVFWGIPRVLRFLFRRASIQALASLLLALGSFVAGAALALHHPLWPMAVLAAFWLVCVVMAWKPELWLFWVPALLPVLNFSPWSGWIVFEEFDILLFAVLAGGYAHRAGSTTSWNRWMWRGGAGGLLPVLLGAATLVALFRGFSDAGGFSFGWFAGYTEALNSWRVFKSLVFALLLWPLLRQELSSASARGLARLSRGVLTGLALVTLAILWERAAYPGLLDFSAPYRTVGLFWEMHVGGGAIDAYLALTTPFIVWALVSADRPFAWCVAALLALLTGYAVLTTFSRGVYLAVASSSFILYLLLWVQKSGLDAAGWWRHLWREEPGRHWRARAGLVLCLALLAEVALVLAGGTFMKKRLSHVNPDFGSRVEHWQQGVGFLSDSGDWWLGKGLGRVPANFAKKGPKSEFSGSVSQGQDQLLGGRVNSFVTVAGPPTVKQRGGGFALTQRVGEVPLGPFQVTLDIRANRRVDVVLEVCQRHLLYDAGCQSAATTVWPKNAGWQHLTLPLWGPAINNHAGFPPRSSLLALSVVNAGGVADFDNVVLHSASGVISLDNSNFSGGLAHWFPAAQSYFLPWHLDSLYVEHLVERGILGLLLFMSLIAYAVWRLVMGQARGLPLAPYLTASLAGAGVVGVASSVMDVPRVALLLYLIAFSSTLATKDEAPT